MPSMSQENSERLLRILDDPVQKEIETIVGWNEWKRCHHHSRQPPDKAREINFHIRVCEGTMNYYRDKMERLTALRQRERLDPESE